jgi:hypothetical protein
MLVGEGRDEVRFFESLLRHMALTDIQIVDYGGKQKLRPFLATLPRIPGFNGLQSLGITRDADEDPVAASQSVNSAVASANLPPTLSVSTYVMPQPDSPGALENLCLATIAGAPLDQCLDRYFDCAAEAGTRHSWSVGNAAKARLQAWLAVQSEPGLRLGEAAQAGLINWEAPRLEPLRSFVRTL